MDNKISNNEDSQNKKLENIKIYDFKKPDKFSKEQLKTLIEIHERFARLTTTSLSTRLKSSILIQVENIDQFSFEDFISSLSSQSVASLIYLEPLGNSILEFSGLTISAVLEKLYGSGINEIEPIKRNITEIEQYLLSDVITALLSNLATALSFLTEIKPKLIHIETNPNLIQNIHLSEMVIIIRFKLKINNIEGEMNFCIPYTTLEPIMSKLSPKYWYSSSKEVNTIKNEKSESIFSLLEDSIAKLSTSIDTQTMSLIEIDNIKEGDEIPLCNITDLVNININGSKVMEGNLGRNNNKWSIKIRKFTNE